MSTSQPPEDRLLRPGEVAALLRVHPRTAGRWVLSGKVPGERTPGGQTRIRESVARALLADQAEEPS